MESMQKKLIRFLRWSEKYTKTDMIYLVSGSFWLSFGTFVTAATSFILSIAFANLLPAAIYGTYKYILSLASIFSTFTLTELSTSVIEAVSRGKEGVLRQAAKTNLLWSIPVSLVTMGVAAYYFLQGNSTLGFSLIIIALLQPIITSASFGEAFLTGKKAFKLSSAYYAINNMVPAAALLIAMFFSKSALLIVAIYFFSYLVTSVGVYLFVQKRLHPNTTADATSIAYGKHLTAINILGGLVDNLDKILIFHFLGAAQLAIYSFALALPSQSKLVTKSISTLLFPKFAAREEHELHQGMAEKAFRFLLLGASMAIIYIIVAPYAYRFFYPKYLEALFLSQIYAISYLGMVASPMGTFLSAKRKVRPQYAMSMLVGVFQIVAVVVGMFFAGLLGLLLARVATRFAGALFTSYFYYVEKNASINPTRPPTDLSIST